MARKRLGELLVDGGFLTDAQLQDVLAAQKGSGRRLGDLLIDRGLITSLKLTQILSYQLKLPWVSLQHVEFKEEVVGRIPATVAREHRVVPVYLGIGDGGARAIYLATDDPTNDRVAPECERICGLEARLMVAASEEIDAALAACYPSADEGAFDGREAKTIPARPSRRAATEPPLEVPTVPDDDVPAAEREPSGALLVAASVVPPPRRGSSEVAPAPEADLTPVAPPSTKRQGRRSGPVVLAIQAPERLLEHSREAAAAAGARLEESDLRAAPTRVAELRPAAIVISEDVFAFDRIAFTELARSGNSQLVIWNDDLAVDYLEPLIASAVGAAVSD